MTDVLAPPSADVIINATNLRMTFGGTAALDGANISVRRGTIHGLVGENGAGKSTALGAIVGRLQVESGEIDIDGHEVSRISARAIRNLGVVAIYQELTTVPGLSACANVYLGQTPSRGGFLARDAMRSRYDSVCKEIGLSIPGGARAGDLSVADQQMLEIMRALESGARIILLDEPTTSLVQSERETLFRIMRDLRSAGETTMVLVSHNLPEVLAICDEITVMRNGVTAATGPVEEWNRERLIASMLGDAAPTMLASHRATTPAGHEDLLRVEDLNVPGMLSDVSLHASRGEILGVAGLVGSGRTTLLRALAGLEPSARGKIVVDGVPTAWPNSVRRALRLGIALIPEDRKRQGLLLHMTGRENIGICSLRYFSRWGFMRNKKMKQEVGDTAKDFALDRRRLEQPVRNLSGGNQQKVLLARWQMKSPKILLADEPTKGIDVGAKESVMTSLRVFADKGATVIVVSSDLEELTTLADRVIVVAAGRLTAELDAGATGVSVDRMLSAAFAE
jgi:ABC-type sugar transport system ATPase subunit